MFRAIIKHMLAWHNLTHPKIFYQPKYFLFWTRSNNSVCILYIPPPPEFLCFFIKQNPFLERKQINLPSDHVLRPWFRLYYIKSTYFLVWHVMQLHTISCNPTSHKTWGSNFCQKYILILHLFTFVSDMVCFRSPTLCPQPFVLLPMKAVTVILMSTKAIFQLL